MSQSNRYAALEESYQSMRHMFQFLSRFYAGGTFLDVGSGEGILSLKIAEDLKAHRIILIDFAHKPVVNLPPHAEFHFADVQSEEFVQQFQNKANVVVCQCVLHELPGPIIAATNVIRILPISGVGLILDYSEQGWARQRAIADAGEEQYPGHYEEDMMRVRFMSQVLGLNLDSNAGIRTFWEEGFFPRVPGECCLSFSGDLYSILYIPKQWGEVKEPPPDIARILKSRRR